MNLKSTEPLALQITGRAQVDQLHTLDTLKTRDFLKWQRLVVEGLNYQHGDSLSIDKVNLLQPYARFMINDDRTTNVDDLLIPQPADSGAKSAPKPAASKDKPLGIRIGQIAINDGSANFADFSLTPNFATAIQQLNGQIGTIDSRQAETSQRRHQGQGGPLRASDNQRQREPVRSDGGAGYRHQLQACRADDPDALLRQVRGFPYPQGTSLNLDLHYVITKGQLKAENKVVVEQLQLGEKVDSADAVDLPIRLAIALLKDTDGKISIELPVTGDLNNPQFSVMPIVWQTLRNLVVRAATAPFKFIGGLVTGGGAEDLSNVSFAAGSSELNKDAESALNTLAKALKERPALRLEIEGTAAASSDGPFLAAQRLEREYQYNYYKILQRRGDKVPAQASLLEVPESEKSAIARRHLPHPRETTATGGVERPEPR